MTRIFPKVLLGAVAAAAIMAATPSSAFVAWACTAKDSSGHKYTRRTLGLPDVDTRPGAEVVHARQVREELQPSGHVQDHVLQQDARLTLSKVGAALVFRGRRA